MRKIIFILPLTLFCGCAGSRCQISARTVHQPVSYTPCVFDATGQICEAKPNEVVQHIKLSRTNWSMFWRGMPLSSTNWDISEEINSQLKAASGNAVVNVKVKASGSDFLDWYLATLLPIIPSYVHVSLDADIVRIPVPNHG